MDVDVVDIQDPDEGRARHRRLDLFRPASVRIELAAGTASGARMVSEISRSVQARKLRVLRIWSSRPPGWTCFQEPEGSAPPPIRSGSLDALSREMGVLHVLFARGGHAELRGCGEGLHGPGRLLAQALARIWGVPVQAGQVLRTTGEWRHPVIQALPSGAVMLVRGARVWRGRQAG